MKKINYTNNSNIFMKKNNFVSSRSQSICGSTASSFDLNQPALTFNLNKAMSLNTSRSLIPIKQYPAICLEHVWNEPPSGG